MDQYDRWKQECTKLGYGYPYAVHDSIAGMSLPMDEKGRHIQLYDTAQRRVIDTVVAALVPELPWCEYKAICNNCITVDSILKEQDGRSCVLRRETTDLGAAYTYVAQYL